MCLLLCFFVLLLSFSIIDMRTYKLVYGSFADAFGIQGKQITLRPGLDGGEKIIPTQFDTRPISLDFISFLQENLLRALKEEAESRLSGMESLLEVSLDEASHQVTIRLMGESTFDSGSAEIRREMVPILSRISAMLNEIDSELIIGGHTDNVPISGWPYQNNLILSMARAASVAQFLIEKGKVDPRRVATMGFGEYHPIETNDTPEGRQKNRRVEITLANLAFQQQIRKNAALISPLDTPGGIMKRESE